MAFEQRNFSGGLFKNNNPDKTETSPHIKGDALIDGVAYWVSAWTKTDKNGHPWHSLSFTKKEDTVTGARIFEKHDTPAPVLQAPAKNNTTTANPFADLDNDIPY